MVVKSWPLPCPKSESAARPRALWIKGKTGFLEGRHFSIVTRTYYKSFFKSFAKGLYLFTKVAVQWGQGKFSHFGDSSTLVLREAWFLWDQNVMVVSWFYWEFKEVSAVSECKILLGAGMGTFLCAGVWLRAESTTHPQRRTEKVYGCPYQMKASCCAS